MGKFFTGFSALLSNPDLFVDFGAVDNCLTLSNEQLIIDNEMFEIMLRFKKGITVSRETIAAELISRVGPKGNYLDNEHTIKHLRSGEHWESVVSLHENYETLAKKEYPDARQNASEIVKKILKEHVVDA